MVLVRDLQWDHLGKEIIHVDFARVSADEAVESHVPLDVRGVVPGGSVEIVVHEVTVLCRANAIPDSIRVEIGHLAVGGAIHARI
jgi:large subunit ribosomal protein L25